MKISVILVVCFTYFMSCQQKHEAVENVEADRFRTVILTDMTHDDGNSLSGELSFSWFRYEAADTYTGVFDIATGDNIGFTLPEDLSEDDIHIILEVRDSGEPALTTYRRVVVGAN